MRARQSNLLETARNVEAFLTANAAILGPTVVPAQQSLTDAADQLTALAATQSGSVIAAKGATAHAKGLRTTLRNNYMKPVATIAKLMLPDVPEISALANTTKNLATAQLVAAAHGMADAADKYSSVFTANGLPADFTNRIRTAADAVTSASTGRTQLVGTASGAVSGLQLLEKRVRSMLQLLNALVVPKLGTNASLLTQWKQARAITNQAPIAPVPSSVSAAAAAGGTTSTTSSPAASSAASPAPAVGTAAPSQGS